MQKTYRAARQQQAQVHHEVKRQWHQLYREWHAQMLAQENTTP